MTTTVGAAGGPSMRARRALGSTTAVFVVLVLVVVARVGEVTLDGAWRDNRANAFTHGFYDWNIRLPDVRTLDGRLIATSVQDQGRWRRLYSMPAMEPWLGVVVHGGAAFGFERRVYDRGGTSPVTVTVSAALTEAALSALRGRPGAVVVLGVNDGAILAAVDTTTAPVQEPQRLTALDFDPGANEPFDFYPGDGQPAISGRAMNPGSTLKPFVVGAALDQKVVAAEEVFTSERGYAPPGGRWIPNANGALCPPVGVVEAIALSCNNVGASLATRLGLGGMRRMFAAAGFGTAPHSDVSIAAASDPLALVAEANPADALTLCALGQGEVRLPVITLAALYAGIANGGPAPTPRFDTEAPPRTWLERVMSSSAAKVVTAGMIAAARHGTASGFGGAEVAAKTGTAENANGTSNGWVAGFYPAHDPKVAFAVVRVAGDGEELSGGRDAVPVAAEVLAALDALGLPAR